MPDIEEFLKPISDEAPAGQDVRYDVVYDEIRDARESDPDLPQGEWVEARKVADFKRVAQLAGEVLRKRSKDLQVAAWLMEAWIHREGFDGLHSGLELQRQLLERFWDTVFPEIDDGDLDYRAAPLEWIAGYLDPAVRAVALNPAGHDFVAYKVGRALGYEESFAGDPEKLAARQQAIDGGKVPPEAFDEAVEKAPKAFYKALAAGIDASLAALDTLEALTDDRFGDGAPSFRPLREVVGEVRRLVQQILAKKLEEDPDPVTAPVFDPSAGPEESSDAGGVASAGGGGLTLEPTSTDDAGTRIAAAARYLRTADPLDPAPYLMVRGYRWGELRRKRGEVDPRLLAAPPTRTRTHLKGLLLDGAWAELLAAAEDVMATPFGRGWLDLQRYVFTAIDGLGSEYGPLELSLKGALRALLVDLPGLPDLTLMDDTPTANRETRTWLQDEGLMGPLTAEEQARLEVDVSVVAGGRDLSERAKERVRAGQPQKAIELLMKAADEAGSVRERLLRRAEAARVMVDHDLASVAMPILRDIMGRIEAHNLEEWEDSETVAVPMALLYRCIDRMGGDEAEKQELYLRVCRLDPMQAILFGRDEAARNAAGTGEGVGDGVQDV